ncbi:MAG: histidine phosphatase family protein [Proteobacteria bacterium]|nr:histidine phosphatase family protein [Pseudomonadota bacterium]
MNTTRFLLIRHAESAWNAAGRWQGHGDPPLSERGRRQAAALAERLAGEGLSSLLSSDLRRAFETAEILAMRLGLSLRTSPVFRELDIGSWTGLTRDELEARARADLATFEAGEPDFRPGGGESRSEIRARVRGGVEDLARRDPGARIGLVTHLGVIRALLPGRELGHVETCWASLAEIRAATASASHAGSGPP